MLKSLRRFSTTEISKFRFYSTKPQDLLQSLETFPPEKIRNFSIIAHIG